MNFLLCGFQMGSHVDTTHSIYRSARHFLAGTFFSRLSGLFRDMAMAFCFGSAPEIAAFMVAYRLANLFRRLLGEGNLQAGFVPQFETYRQESEHRGALFYRDIAFSLGCILLLAVLCLEGLLWGLLSWMTDPDWKYILELAMWMAPGLFFICLYALNSALLQCQKRYFLPAVAPVVFNFIWVWAVLCLWHLPLMQAIQGLSMAVTLAFMGQWLATAFAQRSYLQQTLQKGEWFRPRLFSGEWKAFLKPLSLGTIGIGAVQLNSALDAIFARFADAAGPAYLWYAIRIEQLPLALFGIALSGALLPPLSRALQEGALERYQELLRGALKSCASLIIPCTFGMFALGGVGVNLLYGHGDFLIEDVQQTTICLWAYGIGLFPSVLVLLLAAGFYAQKEYRWPALASVISVALNILLNALFVFGLQWGAISIALATSIGSFCNALILTMGLRQKVGSIFAVDFWAYCGKMTFCSAVAAAAVWQVETAWMDTFPRSLPVQLFQMISLSGIYFGGLILLVGWLRLEEFFALFQRTTPEELDA